jgi:molybdate transport system substrate-binding protein
MPHLNIFERVLLLATMVCWLASPGFAQKRLIRVAAAADLQTAMPEIAKAFESQTGTNLAVVYGSSGNFYAQIQNGAPLDVFFSADSEYPRRLEESGFAGSESAAVYAIGRIVLWMPASGNCNPEVSGWKCLTEPGVKKIAIANPAHAPYGRAAVEALTNVGIYEQIREKFVFGENILQAAQFLQSGNAQAGILAYSLTRSPALRGGKLWEIPRGTYSPIEQSVVVLKSAKDKSAAQDFVKFVIHGPGRAVLVKYGFEPPAAPR